MSRGPSTRSLTTRTRVYSLFSPLFSFHGIEDPLRPLRSYAPPFVGSYLPKSGLDAPRGREHGDLRSLRVPDCRRIEVLRAAG
jgi:hypothetical protein